MPKFFDSPLLNILLAMVSVVVIGLVLRGMFAPAGDFAAPVWEMLLLGIPLSICIGFMLVGRFLWLLYQKQQAKQLEINLDD